MKHRLGGLVILPVLLAATAALSWPETAAAAGRVYRLSERSTYQNGCFPPCRCPLQYQRTVRGVFKLTPTGVNGLFERFAVSDVNWIASVKDTDVPDLRITGSGTYEIGGEFAIVQRLQLDLVVNGNPAQHFDSGFVSYAGGQFPAVNVTVSINQMMCHDTVIAVDAAPVRPSSVQRYRLIAPSTFQQGCGLSPNPGVSPCDCPLGPVLPIRGTLRLVPLAEGPLVSEFAVIDVRWWIPEQPPPASPRLIRITGGGFYEVQGECAVDQRLVLDLMIGGDGPVHLDSGLVPGGGGFPARIDASVLTGGSCFERKIEVHAQQGPLFGRHGVRCTGNSECPESHYCFKGRGALEAPGVCRQRRYDLCPLYFDSVCGCDGHTYGNACEAAVAGVKVKHEGRCDHGSCDVATPCPDGQFCEMPRGVCASGLDAGICWEVPEACSKVYRPVCGCDGRTYGNDCERRAAKVQKSHDGPCGMCRTACDCEGMEFQTPCPLLCPACGNYWTCENSECIEHCGVIPGRCEER